MSRNIEVSLLPKKSDNFIQNQECDGRQHFNQKEENYVLCYDGAYSNSKGQYSGSPSSSISGDSVRESISPPPLCPVSSIYPSFKNDALDHTRDTTATTAGDDETLEKDGMEPIQQPWNNHIPKHYSLDYDFSDDWDLVIEGTAAATGTGYSF